MLDTRVWLYCTISLNRKAKALRLTCEMSERELVETASDSFGAVVSANGAPRTCPLQVACLRC